MTAAQIAWLAFGLVCYFCAMLIALVEILMGRRKIKRQRKEIEAKGIEIDQLEKGIEELKKNLEFYHKANQR